ncbi:hypothetical protein B5M09_004406 [Aphanomyces astaci]|uniref:non-specific serine/threonine protein kinase n=1 Tax=Aphanomyces astaci TaxID=112090 RepID=A0A425DLN0_APHAT|nr:hypothetical protein B5M09_004406 [Aphanomyces astaci]
MTDRLKTQSPADFWFGTTLGEGAYARVVHARLKATNEEFAVKIMEKRFISKEKKVKFVMMERKVFSKVSHDRIVKLSFSFQDRNYLYMVMELCRGGELLDVIVYVPTSPPPPSSCRPMSTTHTCSKAQKEQAARGVTNKACSFDVTQFFIAEVIEALEYLHEMVRVSPENILLNEAGHLKITDFGTAKVCCNHPHPPTCHIIVSCACADQDETEEGARQNTFCGTAEFVSPEVLRDHEASRGCDLWAVGCMIYQMLVGRPAFRAENEYLTFQQILNHPAEDFSYPEGFPEVAQDLCSRLLLQDPKARLGAGTNADGNGYDALKVLSHPFFTGINWATLGRSTSPYVPHISPLPPTDSVRVNRFLLDDEVIRMSGLVSKRKGLFSKTRQVTKLSYVPARLLALNMRDPVVRLILVIRNCSTSQVVRRRCNLSSRWNFERNLSESSSYVTMQAFECQQPQWTELSSPQPDASFAAKNTPTPTSTTTFFATRPHIVIPKECMNMMSKTSPLSVHALHAGTALECELSNMGYDVAAEYLFWKEENLALLEMSFPAMDRDILEEVLVETEFDLGAAVDVIRSRVDVINDMGVEVSLDDMLQHYGEHRRSAHEWVLIQDDWEVIDDMLVTMPTH